MSISDLDCSATANLLPHSRATARPVLRAYLGEAAASWTGQINVPGWYAWDVRVVRGEGRRMTHPEVTLAENYVRDKIHGIRVFDSDGHRYRFGDQEYEMLLAVASMAGTGLIDQDRALDLRVLQAFLCRGAGQIDAKKTRHQQAGLNNETRNRLRKILLRLSTLRVSWRYGVLSPWSSLSPVINCQDIPISRRSPEGRDRRALIGLSMGAGWTEAERASSVPLRADACFRISTTVGRLAYIHLSSHSSQHDGSNSASGPVGGRSLNSWPILERLGYSKDDMLYPSQRARRITAIVEQIKDKPLSRGRFLAAVVEMRPTSLHRSVFSGGNDSVAILVQALGGSEKYRADTPRHDCVLIRDARSWFGDVILSPRLKQHLVLDQDDRRKLINAVGQNAYQRSERYFQLVKTIFGPDGGLAFDTVIRDFIDDRRSGSSMLKPAAVLSYRFKSSLKLRAVEERKALEKVMPTQAQL